MASERPYRITHILPVVGLVELDLYPPADRVFSVLLRNQEKRRLNDLRHLGSFTHAFPGSRYMRWDYTVAMLHYASLIKGPGGNSSFRIGSMEYSSLTAGLQCLSLIWNIGHLPGTFAVEKGVYQYLRWQSPSKPASSLQWPSEHDAEIEQIQDHANTFLKNNDYLGMSRVLATVKLLKYAKKEERDFFDWITSFASPFLLDYEDRASLQWHKLATVFPVVRHAAYLTIDHGISGLAWVPDIPPLLNSIVSRSPSFEVIRDTVSEILSPVERQVFDRLYHNETARKEAAIVSDHVFRHLKDRSDANRLIDKWLEQGSFSGLKLGHLSPLRSCQLAGSLRLRSHFSPLSHSVADIEGELRKKHFGLPIVLEYRSWNSDVVLEPDELIVDIMTTDNPTTTAVGKLLAWCICKFEDFEARPQDDFSIIRKIELGSTYLDFFVRAFNLALPGINMRFQPWPLREFGIFGDFLESGVGGGLWATSARMDDPITRHMTRDRSGSVPSRLHSTYVEMLGLIQLRKLLMRRWVGSTPRQRCLLVTGSVRFATEERDLIEFDGGILTVSCRGGKIHWYGLESKSGDSDPKHVLECKLNRVGIRAPVFALANKHAYMVMEV